MKPSLRALTATFVALTVGACEDSVTEGSGVITEVTMHVGRRPREECLAPRLTVYREVFEDFFRFEDVEPDSPAYGFVRASMIAVVEAFEQGEPFRREDAEQLATGEWPLPNLPAEYR